MGAGRDEVVTREVAGRRYCPPFDEGPYDGRSEHGWSLDVGKLSQCTMCDFCKEYEALKILCGNLD